MYYNPKIPNPPKFPLWLLRRFCTERWIEEIEGDFEEEFALNLEKVGIKAARKKYFWTVIKSFRLYLLVDKLKSSQNHKQQVMFINFIKITLRSLLKNRAYSFINISGLAIGIAGALLILHYVSFEKSYDNFQEDASDIYRVSLDIFQNGEQVFKSAENYPGVGPAMVQEFPEVTAWAHLYNMGAKNNVVITYEEGQGQPIKFKHKKFLYASPNFLPLFSTEMLNGDAKTALVEPFTMVISETTAKKYFGNENPIGKHLRLKDDDFNDENCVITGVFKDLPPNTHLKYDVLISTATLYGRFEGATARYKTGWGRKDFYTYIKVAKGTDVTALEAKFPPLVDKYKPELKDNNGVNILALQPLQSIHLDSHLGDEAELNGNGEPLTFLTIIAIFIVLIAWVNYINLATSRSLDRAKEVGIRKVLGSLRGQLISQFMLESIAINLLSVISAIIIIAVALPAFHKLSGIPVEVKIWNNTLIWIVLGLIFLVGSFVSGFYPALVLSSFKPVSTLKGKFRNSGSGILLRKVLVVFQFATSAALIIGTFTVYRQMQFVKNAELGFEMDQIIVVERPAISNSDPEGRNQQILTFGNELRANSNIKELASSGIVPGKKIRFKADVRAYNQPAGQTFPLNYVGADFEFIKTMGMHVIAGRDFSRDFPHDLDTAVLVTRSALVQLGYENPEDIIGQTIVAENFGASAIVIGVVEDYNHESLREKAIPSVFLLNPFWAEYFLIKVQENNIPSALAAIEEEWESTFPGNPFDYFFLDEFFNEQYKSEDQFQSIFSVFAVMAIFIGCLGLFGLSAFMAMTRTKEIGVRKVLGASNPQLFYLLSKEFIVLILISNVISWPLIYIAMDNWLQGFEYRTNINLFMFLLSTVLIVVIALATVSFQTVKSTRQNPVDSLKYE
jgi:putative ABC transport system permease protein